jgi:hypothetical protein
VAIELYCEITQNAHNWTFNLLNENYSVGNEWCKLIQEMKYKVVKRFIVKKINNVKF